MTLVEEYIYIYIYQRSVYVQSRKVRVWMRLSMKTDMGRTVLLNVKILSDNYYDI